MKLLGEDSPVSKLQVKLEPGATPATGCPRPCRSHPAEPACPTASGWGVSVPTVAGSLQRPGWAPLASLSWPLPLTGPVHRSPVQPSSPPEALRQGSPHPAALGPSCCTDPERPDPTHGTQEVEHHPQRGCPLAGVNPSHLMNLFTYEKGYCFVYYLSQLCGDPQRFDDFLRVSGLLLRAGPAL